MLTFETRDAALGALQDGQIVCATIMTGGKPTYFTMQADATDEAVRDRAFEIKHGRKIGATELTIEAMARRRRTWR